MPEFYTIFAQNIFRYFPVFFGGGGRGNPPARLIRAYAPTLITAVTACDGEGDRLCEKKTSSCSVNDFSTRETMIIHPLVKDVTCT